MTPTCEFASTFVAPLLAEAYIALDCRYLFDAGQGEVVTIELDGDSAKDHRGEQASLQLRGADGTTLGSAAGAVPLTLEATPPHAGTYAVVVNEASDAATAFRGHYRLEVKAASRALLTPEPQPSVEP